METMEVHREDTGEDGKCHPVCHRRLPARESRHREPGPAQNQALGAQTQAVRDPEPHLPEEHTELRHRARRWAPLPLSPLSQSLVSSVCACICVCAHARTRIHVSCQKTLEAALPSRSLEAA